MNFIFAASSIVATSYIPGKLDRYTVVYTDNAE